MMRPNTNPSRLDDTGRAKRLNSPNPLVDDYRGGMAFGHSSPGWDGGGSHSPDRLAPTGDRITNGLAGAIDYLKRC
jgi:hypothetical protein